jgi:hypothetical protein
MDLNGFEWIRIKNYRIKIIIGKFSIPSIPCSIDVEKSHIFENNNL